MEQPPPIPRAYPVLLSLLAGMIAVIAVENSGMSQKFVSEARLLLMVVSAFLAGYFLGRGARR